MPDLFSTVLLVFVALVLIGPTRLPQGLEALWLAVQDYGRSQRGQPLLETIENARRYWVSSHDSVFAFIQILYRITEHLQELRQRLLVSIAVLAVTFGVAIAFAQPLLGLLIQPINVFPLQVSDVPISRYVLGEDVQLTLPVTTTTGAITETLTIPRGTPLPLSQPSPKPVFLKPTELFAQYIKIALVVAIAISLPVLVYELLMFLRGPMLPAARMNPRDFQAQVAMLPPEQAAALRQERKDRYSGLTASEMRPLYILAPLAGLFFIAGLLFTYFVLLPNALAFLFGLGGSLVQPLPSLEEYVGFSLSLMIWVAVAFETPLVMFFLARFRIVKPGTFAAYWRYAIVAIAVIAAVITPTVDPFNMALVMAPMILLYLIGIVLARFA